MNKIKLHRRSATLTTVPLAAITGEKPDEQPRPLRPFERDDEPAMPVLDAKEQERLREETEKANAESYERYLAPRIAAAKELTVLNISLTTAAILLNVEQAVLEARLGLTEPQPSAAKAAKATRRKKA